jgi:glutamate carboxypeptidase
MPVAVESQITEWLATQQDAMVALLREIVDTDSGSYNKAGIDAVGDSIRRFLERRDIPVETIRQQKHGDCLRAQVPWHGPAGNAGGNVVLMGHRDTVFPTARLRGAPSRSRTASRTVRVWLT